MICMNENVIVVNAEKPIKRVNNHSIEYKSECPFYRIKQLTSILSSIEKCKWNEQLDQREEIGER